MKLLGGLCLVASASACVVEDPEVGQIVLEAKKAPDCDVWGCGTNSAYFEDQGFYRLHLDGTPNEQGFAAKNFRKGTTSYGSWDVFLGGLSLMNPSNGGSTASGFGTVGATFDITLNGQNRYFVTVAGFGGVEGWAKQYGSGQKIETYELVYTDHPDWPKPTMGGRRVNVCPRSPSSSDALGMVAQHVLFFERDNIEAATKTVGTSNKNYVNVACAGSALAKMHLTGHTEISALQGFSTTIEERQTMLKMLTADYCGNGNAHTIGGQPLNWADDKDWMNLPPAPSYLEAVWTKDGARCLNQPRLTANPPPTGVPMPAVEACMSKRVIPDCGGSNPYNPPSGYHLISSNPYSWL